jgi:hypothetical protein
VVATAEPSQFSVFSFRFSVGADAAPLCGEVARAARVVVLVVLGFIGGWAGYWFI